MAGNAGEDKEGMAPSPVVPQRQIFRFAETVSMTDRVDATRTKALRTLITEKLKNPLLTETPKAAAAKNAEKVEGDRRKAKYKLLQERRTGSPAAGRSSNSNSSTGGGGGGSAASENDAMKDLFRLYDVVKEDEEFSDPTEEELKDMPPQYREILCNSLPLLRSLSLKEDEYVYDVYYQTGQRAEQMEVFQDAGFIQVDSLPDDTLLPEYDSDEDRKDLYDEDEDSNDEAHWKNDYPEDEDRDDDHDPRDPFFEEDEDEDQLSDDDHRLEAYYGFEEDSNDYSFYEEGDE